MNSCIDARIMEGFSVLLTVFLFQGCGNDETQFSGARPNLSENLEEKDGGLQETAYPKSADIVVQEKEEGVLVEPLIEEPEPVEEKFETHPPQEIIPIQELSAKTPKPLGFSPTLAPVVEPIENQNILLKLDNFKLSATLRDFKDSHPDMERYASGLVQGLVMNELGADRVPVLNGKHPNLDKAINSESSFNQWYRDVDGINASLPFDISFTRDTDNPDVFYFEDLSFFPLDDKLFGNQNRKHNYHFTLELHTDFIYRGGEIFEFTGDDDVWLFIDNKLVVDIGGTHSSLSDQIELDSLGLEKGKRYQFDFFFAERKTTASRFRIETSLNFTIQKFQYQIRAKDPGGLPLKYSKILGPEKLIVSENSGLIYWNAGEEQIGLHQVKVLVENSSGVSTPVEFTIEVKSQTSESVPR